MEISSRIFNGDCLDVLKQIEPNSIDLIYIDPPFFTQRVHKLSTNDGKKEFKFRDVWNDEDAYANFLFDRILIAKEVLKETGSIFFHCNKSGSHIARAILDSIFSPENFQSEIIWYFKRWSNSKKGLLPAHQTIFFYSKTPNFKFNQIFKDYAPSTNIDQIMQKRIRDDRNKSVYAINEKDGTIINNGAKKGVPLSDVWEIPFLNPKAKERVSYPTQKPILLMNQIIRLVTHEGDKILDPFCGSGTTLVASKLLNRHSVGIDISSEAVALTKSRLSNPIMTNSKLLEVGRDHYKNHSPEAAKHLSGINYTPIQRNNGLDGLLKQELNGVPVFIRVQRENETISDTINSALSAIRNKGVCSIIIIETALNSINFKIPNNVSIIPSTELLLKKAISSELNFNTRMNQLEFNLI